MRAQIESKSRVWWSVAFLVQRQSLANHYLTTEAKHQDCVSTIVTIICITVTIFFKDFRIPCQANRNIILKYKVQIQIKHDTHLM